MKALIIFLAMLLTGVQTSDAGEPWSEQDIQLEAAYLMLHAVDWGQTRTIATSDEFWETNPILGSHPTVAEVNRYFVATALLHVAITDSLHPRYRPLWQKFTIGVEAGYVGHNINLGITLEF